MTCQRCSGRGMVWFDEEHYGMCPECHAGQQSCCEGSERTCTFVPVETPPNLKVNLPLSESYLALQKEFRRPTGSEFPAKGDYKKVFSEEHHQKVKK